METLKAQLIRDELITQKTFAIYDYDFIKSLQKMPLQDWLAQPAPFRCREEYLDFYHQWIASSTLNTISGLNTFSRRDLINGTTQTFDEAYMKYAHRRLRIFRGEYRYHARCVESFLFIEDEPLKTNDYVIVSAPFCSTGDIHPQMSELLETCYSLQIPVIVDCAYFGTCSGINLDVNHPAIESVSFSLSKGTGLGDVRSGIRYSHLNDNYPICQQNNFNHTVLFAAKVGLYMMSIFSPDFIPARYQKTQQEVCKALGITPTKCMHLALGDETWSSFCIDDKYNRIGLRELVRTEYKKQKTGTSVFSSITDRNKKADIHV
ncbi:MAG: hypothetical protein IT287_07890 [Bdellovibrionaceae bacterium]|nr:hypothetical protein [Pseudobdellovibrionaceae bacterium]